MPIVKFVSCVPIPIKIMDIDYYFKILKTYKFLQLFIIVVLNETKSLTEFSENKRKIAPLNGLNNPFKLKFSRLKAIILVT